MADHCHVSYLSEVADSDALEKRGERRCWLRSDTQVENGAFQASTGGLSVDEVAARVVWAYAPGCTG